MTGWFSLRSVQPTDHEFSGSNFTDSPAADLDGVLVGLGDTGGNVGVGNSGLVDCGLASGDCLGEGNSGARLLLAFTALLSLAVAAFVFSSAAGVGDTAVLAFALVFAFAFASDEGLTHTARGIPARSDLSGAPQVAQPGCLDRQTIPAPDPVDWDSQPAEKCA